MTTEALALGLATQVQRWATRRGAPADAAWAAAQAARLLSLAGGLGHVCIWLDALPTGSAELPSPTAPPGTSLPADATAWRARLLASGVVGSAQAPAGQPLVLDADGRLYLHRQFNLECRLAQRLLQSAAPLGPHQPADPQADAATAAQLAALFGTTAGGGPGGAPGSAPGSAPGDAPDWQALATALALRNHFTVISGGPGTGKTTTVVNLLACLLARDPAARVVMAAPTGKAAARLAEALRQRAAQLPTDLQALLPTSATTVHRLLGVRPGRGGQAASGEQAFEHHAGAPLALDVLVLDEASMLDLALATRLLEAVPPQARIVLLGDKDQLAAVESGAVFAELSADPSLSPATKAQLAQLCSVAAARIQPPTPQHPALHPGTLPDSVVWFQRNFRFAANSGIGRLAADAVAGQSEALLATLHQGAADLHWLDDANPAPAAATLDAITMGYAGHVAACRAALAGALSPAEAATQMADAFSRFRVLCALREGPRGVQAMNAVIGQRLHALIGDGSDPRQPWHAGRPVMVLRNDPVLRLFNGDIGITLPDAHGRWQVWFAGPDGNLRAVPAARLPAHETAWAMTVHKAQGSEFERLLLLLPAQRSRVLSRALLYTGITRARQQLLLAAGTDVLVAAVNTNHQRQSGLQARLRDAKQSAMALVASHRVDDSPATP